MFSKAVAYVLGVISFIPPFNGLPRFYLKRYGSGVIFTATSGCFFIGNILDIVQIPHLVKRANMRYKQRQLENMGLYPELEDHRAFEANPDASAVEQAILRSAKKNSGLTTPTEVALESSVSIERARESLDYLVSKGFAEIRVNKSGVIVYRFPDIIDPNNTEEFDELT